MILQAIHDISEICAKKGVKQAIISPGSRSAPLTISFARNQNIETFIFPDERSAAFQGIGMHLNTGNPVALVCTSGSAAYNYAPAVAEAYYQQIPLIVFTADRPTEWIDQLDGQTIQQQNIYGKHVKASYQLPDQYEAKDSYWHINRIVNEAINKASEYPKGPVHINVPLREPFYPESTEELRFSSDIRIIEQSQPTAYQGEHQILETIQKQAKVLVVAGQSNPDKLLKNTLERFIDHFKITLISDVISNMATAESITHQDLFLSSVTEEIAQALQPEVLITFGKSVISKNLKLFLRNYPPAKHYHIQESGYVADTFQHLTDIIHCSPHEFFLSSCRGVPGTDDFTIQKRKNYNQTWSLIQKSTKESLEQSYTDDFTELGAVECVLNSLPKESALHLANSMPVRWANFIGVEPSIQVYANRGTSGIDGSNSTAYGYAIQSDQVVTLLTGDMAFFYDRNAFWNQHTPKNLRVIILNNHGGGIFKMIKGPLELQELDRYFVTEQRLNASNLCQEFGYAHYFARNFNELNNVLKTFFHSAERPKVLEIMTDADKNIKVIKKIKEQLSSHSL